MVKEFNQIFGNFTCKGLRIKIHGRVTGILEKFREMFRFSPWARHECVELMRLLGLGQGGRFVR